MTNEQAHPDQELDPLDAERLEAFAAHTLEEKAFRLAVARKYYAHGKDTAEVAAELGCDEAQVWNVLDKIKRERIDA